MKIEQHNLHAPLTLQLSHLFLSFIWNITGVYLVSRGGAALGPTASMLTALVLLIFGALMFWGAKSKPILYVIISALAMLGAATAIYGAWSKDPSLWPSDFWRYTGVVLNSLGVIGALWGFIRLLSTRQK
jgi:hypothetical protein